MGGGGGGTDREEENMGGKKIKQEEIDFEGKKGKVGRDKRENTK